MKCPNKMSQGTHGHPTHNEGSHSGHPFSFGTFGSLGQNHQSKNKEKIISPYHHSSKSK